MTAGVLDALMRGDAPSEVRQALGLNESSRVLLVSTEGDRPGKLPADHQQGGLIPMLVPVPRGPGLNSLLFYRKGGIAEAVTDEAGKGTLQKRRSASSCAFIIIEIGWSEIFACPS